MKGLYLTATYITQESGVSKKILSQIKSLEKNGIEMELCCTEENNRIFYRKIYCKGIVLEKVNRRFELQIYYSKLLEYIIQNNYNFIYMRYLREANPFFNNFLKKLKQKKIKIILEIPTYPYDKEAEEMYFFRRIRERIEKVYRQKIYKYVDKIVTYSQDEKIYKIPCINIENGIDLDMVALTKKKIKNTINFICVSTCHFWHGIDRFLYSLLQYKKNGGKEKIKFHIVGEGSETPKLKKIVEENIELQDIVIFHGFKSGEELDEVYNNSDIALGSLGFYRSGLKKGSTLKMREYCAKGLPFVVGYDDTSFSKDLPFYYQVSNDESLLDIEKIIEWYKNLKVTPKEIRKYAEDNLSWDKQMKKVIDNI